MKFAALLVVFCFWMPQEEDLRNLSGMSDEDSAAVKDNEAFDASNAQFKKLLYRTGTVDGTVLRKWAARSKDVSVDQVATDPSSHRFHPFSLNVKANSIHRFDFAPEDARDFLSGFYFANCETKDGTDFVLVSRSSVASWPTNQKLSQPQQIDFTGFFLGNLSIEFDQDNDSRSRPVFVTRRFAWHPDRESSELQVDAAKVALAKAGVDISLLDIVKSRKGKPIGNRESTCYWQMLAACKTALPTDSKDRIDFPTMLRSPIDSVGKAATIRGRVRQCVPVKVTSPEAIELLGTDTWYQLTIFPDLDGRPIEVGKRNGGSEVYNNAFPVTVCAVNLPQGFDFESIVGNTFQYNGFFYRIWSYPSERTEKSGLAGQPSPLIMASSMVKMKSSSSQLETMLGAILVAMAVAIGFLGWFVFRSKKSAPRIELPDQIKSW